MFLIKFKFILPIIYLLVASINILGFDDMNLLLFMASPLLWISENSLISVREVNIIVVSLSSLLFWFLLGSLIDYIVFRVKNYKRNDVGHK